MSRDRITEKDLQAVVDRINRITGSPMIPYARDDSIGRHVAQIGNYHISHTYGGVCLHRMVTTGGGVSSVLGGGHVPKRDLYDRMHAYLAGLEESREAGK